jgi:hypothetical protein
MKKIIFILLLLAVNITAHGQSVFLDKETNEKLKLPTITYDKFQDITWYQSGIIGLTNSDVYNISVASMDLSFGCYGNTGENPCKTTNFLLTFSYSPENNGIQPFDYQNSNVICLADNSRLLLGRMKVNYNSNYRRYSGTLNLSAAKLKQIVWAKDIEFLVGVVAFKKLDSYELETLGNFYKLAMKAYQKTKPLNEQKQKTNSTKKSKV